MERVGLRRGEGGVGWAAWRGKGEEGVCSVGRERGEEGVGFGGGREGAERGMRF